MVAALALVAGACGNEEDTIDQPLTTMPAVDSVDSVDPADSTPAVAEPPAAFDAWVRMPAMGQSVAAAYVTFVNTGLADVRLVGVSSPIAEAELHETVADDDGVMRMQHRSEGFVVPSEGELVMRPGGIHVMLLGVDVLDLVTVGEVELEFDFEGLDPVVVMAEVRGEVPNQAETDDDHDDHDDQADDSAHEDHSAHGGQMTPGEVDPAVMHALDDELHAGVFELERQLQVVAQFRAALLAAEAPEGFDSAELLEVLDQLDAALASGDRETAAALAFRAHDLAHAFSPHDHSHSH